MIRCILLSLLFVMGCNEPNKVVLCAIEGQDETKIIHEIIQRSCKSDKGVIVKHNQTVCSDKKNITTGIYAEVLCE